MHADDANRLRPAGWIWIFAVQFFIAQAVVQSSWTTPFSLATNYISDLGNTACGPYPAGSSSYVCSPWHAVMNASFIVTGVCLLAGALLLRRTLGTGRTNAAGLALVALGGPGFILVGAFPENVNHPPHYLGAALNFVGANAGLLVLGVASLAGLGRPGFAARTAAYTAASGMVGLAATVLLVTEHFLGVGVGGIERIAAYPLPLWMIVTGIQLLRAR
jgi:hypothetical membrane protein